MDMSVGNINSKTLEIPYADLRPGMEITVEGMEKCGCTEITAVSEEMVAVRWSGHDYEIRLGDKMKSDGILCHNIYLSVDEVYMEYSFEEKTMWDKDASHRTVPKAGNGSGLPQTATTPPSS